MIRKITPERLSFFSDGILAVLITVYPYVGLALSCCLAVYLRPAPPAA